jgi:tetratricopeptide (TPR) repeat protein
LKDSVSNILREVKSAMQQDNFGDALSLLEQVLKIFPENKTALLYKAEIGMQTRDKQITEAALKSLILIAPHNLQYSITLAQLYFDNGELERAPKVFEPLIQQFKHPDLHFNYAWFLTRAADYNNALENYQKAINLGLQGSEEAHLNMANIYSSRLFQQSLAKTHLMLALKIRPNYVDALYNLGNLEEDSGDRTAAKLQFQRILSIDPSHAKATARLAQANDDDSPTLISKLERLIENPSIEDDSRIDCLYALGKLHDQQGNYKQAFESWTCANTIDQKFVGKFDRSSFTKSVNRLIEVYSESWFKRIELENRDEPVFICGMFRSGSTLLEQMLASHPQLVAGGELDYFHRTAKKMGSANPPDSGYSTALLNSVADGYNEQLQLMASPETRVTDKRPDNALHIGLIKTVFPQARIILTRRQDKDTCLSIYSHRFARDMNYACDLEDINFYSNELNRLTEHWITLFAETIHVVDYDDLVKDPKQVISGVLRFIHLDWDAACLDFHHLRNVVSTASVWQVRQPLYSRSSGRWKNYRTLLGDIFKSNQL